MSDNVWSSFGVRPYGKLFTLYFDGSHNNQANKAGAGCIIRDSQGKVVIAAAYNLTETFPENCTVAIAEAVALRNGLQLAKDNNLKLNLIKGDSREVIDHVEDRSRRPSKLPLSGIIQQIIGMIDRFSLKFVLINREANKPADKLASIGSSMHYGGRQIFRTPADLPPQVTVLVKQDMSYGSSSEAVDGEGDSMAETIVKAGAAVAGIATIGWGIYKLLSGESSSDQIANHTDRSHQNTHKYILHFNGSDINQYSKGGAGCIIRNKKGELFKAAAYNLDDLNAHPKQFHVAIAGAMAWLNGMKLAKQNNVKLHLIKGKNEEVINRVLGRQRRLPEVQFLSELVLKIKMALIEQSIDPESQVELIGEGEGNEVAHELANHGSNRLQFGDGEIYTMEEDLPPKVYQLLQQDKMNFRENYFLM